MNRLDGISREQPFIQTALGAASPTGRPIVVDGRTRRDWAGPSDTPRRLYREVRTGTAPDVLGALCVVCDRPAARTAMTRRLFFAVAFGQRTAARLSRDAHGVEEIPKPEGYEVRGVL